LYSKENRLDLDYREEGLRKGVISSTYLSSIAIRKNKRAGMPFP
jgi:hypothetical protein